MKTINEMKQFVKILKTINIYFDLNIKVYDITFNTNKKKRQEILTKFKYDNNFINILCNVHILDEGIDIPECDSIYLTHPNNNPINIIQRISRANRLDINDINKIAKILIWSKDEVKLEQIMKNINKIINIKYGYESNEFVNKKIVNIVNIENIIDTNMNIDTSMNIDINIILSYYNSINKNIDEKFINFIKTFYYILNNNFINDFPINIETVSLWLNSMKGKLKETLVNTYTQNIDYKIIKEKEGKISKSNKEIIMLTADCFK